MPKQFTITVSLKSHGSKPPTLELSGKGEGGKPQNTPSKRHRVSTGSQVQWICPDGKLFIAFYQDLAVHGKKVLQAEEDHPTDPLIINGKDGKATHYLVAVVTDETTSVGVFEDPILEDGGDVLPGDPVRRKTPVKKGAKKKSKKREFQLG